MKSLFPFASDWTALSALLDEALSLPAQDRKAWLEGLTDERAAHREALQVLLQNQAAVETDDFLGHLPALNAAPETPDTMLDMGSCIGPYRLVAELGQGGMATVWLAERADGLMARRVALKLPRIAWGASFTERLAREREILATLEHEHIARLYDAGVDAQGRPYLAMEHVKGEPIDAWCAGRELTVVQRIPLLIQTMAAVAHAHAHLVVHRDLKPSNILVTEAGDVKLLDFGIAKLLDGDLTSQTALTKLAGRALTPDYASPEQIRGEPLGTASDVYSLAVVAYELFSGSKPYRLKRTSAAELEEAIVTVGAPLASSSASDPRMARQLRGDIDSILNKALKKSPGERYQTMDAFADDLRRYVAGEPVHARPDRLAYRARKFIGRHRLQLSSGAVVGTALVVGLSVALWQAREARMAAETAQAVQGFIESVFNSNSRNQTDPALARQTTARQLLDRGFERIDKELGAEPAAQLRLYDLMAEMYVGMALHERGLLLERRSLELATRLYGPQSEAALSAAANMGQTLDDLGQREEAIAVLSQADATAGRRRNDRDLARMMIDTGLARVHAFSDPAKALERARRAAAIARALGPSQDGIGALATLSDTARMTGHLEEARQALVDEAAWVQQQGTKGILPDLLVSLGAVQNELGELEAAGATLARALVLSEQADSPQTLHTARYALSRFQYENGLLREALEIADQDADWASSLGTDQEFGDTPALALFNQGRTLVAFGDAARGLVALDRARVMLPPQQEIDRLAPLLAARADALIALRRLSEANADSERAVALASRQGQRVVDAVRAVRRRYWVAVGSADKALQDFYASAPKAGSPTTPYKLLRRQSEEAMLLLAADRTGAARTLAAEALAKVERLPEHGFNRDTEAQLTAVLGQALLREEHVAEALPVLTKALALHINEYGPAQSPATAEVRLALTEARQRAARR